MVHGSLIGRLNKIWSRKVQFSKAFVMNDYIIFEGQIVAVVIIDTLMKSVKISQKHLFRYA